MTEEEKQKLLEEFKKPVRVDEDVIEDDWTEDEILEASKRIMERLGL